MPQQNLTSLDPRKLLAIRRVWDTLSPEEQARLFSRMPKREREILIGSWQFMARTLQLPPVSFGTLHTILLMLGGRGAGKSRTGSELAADHIVECWIDGIKPVLAFVGKSAGEIRKEMIEGESGVLNVLDRRGIEYDFLPSIREIKLKRGGVIHYYSAEKPRQLRGPQFTFAWCDELSSWQYDQETWDMLRFTMRSGGQKFVPKTIITTTPKPRPLLRAILEKKTTRLVNIGSTYDNKDHLAASYIEELKEDYEGTRLGRQELFAEILWELPGALWKQGMIDDTRVDFKDQDGCTSRDILERLHIVRVMIGVDPATTNNINSDLTGIVVAGVDEDGIGYILEDASFKGSPDQWARKVINLFHKWEADKIIAEVNQGGDMVETILRKIYNNIPYESVHASKGKYARAEPISALYEQGKVCHVGRHLKLEDEMCTFDPECRRASPDRMDALVWVLTKLMLKRSVRFRII